MTVGPVDALGGISQLLREELLDEFNKLIRNYRECRWEPAELDGGRYCEVVYTVVKGYIDRSFPSTATKPKNMIDACRQLEQVKRNVAPHSFRILVPRLICALYDIRNNRGVGHVGGDVNSNQMDATLVVQVAQWILAELIRVHHSVTTDEAQQIVEGLIGRMVPVVWQLPDGRLRVLEPSLSMRQRMLVILYYKYPCAVTEAELVRAVEHSNASVFRRDVLRPAHRQALIDYDETNRMVCLSPRGVREAEERIDLHL